MVVGIGGQYCAGKSALAHLFANNGYHVIDVDGVGHTVLQESAAAVMSCFGSDIAHNGRINRTLLGRVVFRNRRALHQLERIVHPPMRRRIVERIQELKPNRVVIDAALLYYLELDPLCDAVVWVQSSFWRRLRRAMARDNGSLRAALRVMRAQKRLKLGATHADIYIVSNNMSKERFTQTCTQTLQALWQERA